MGSYHRRNEKWVSRGIISASECFTCVNRVGHRLMGARVSILCRDQCNYEPLKGEQRPELDDIEKTGDPLNPLSAHMVYGVVREPDNSN
jgi:hypothetical protein